MDSPKKQSNFPLYAGIGGVGLGVGLNELSKKILSPEDAAIAENFSKNVPDWVNKSDFRDSVDKYTTEGSKMMNLKPFGVPAVDFMKGMRDTSTQATAKLQDILDKYHGTGKALENTEIGKALALHLPNVPDKAPSFGTAWTDELAKHYGNFQHGPITGLLRLQHEADSSLSQHAGHQGLAHLLSDKTKDSDILKALSTKRQPSFTEAYSKGLPEAYSPKAIFNNFFHKNVGLDNSGMDQMSSDLTSKSLPTVDHVNSIKKLIGDTKEQWSKGVVPTGEDINPALHNSAIEFAKTKGFKGLYNMSPADQQAAYPEFDNYLKHSNPALWAKEQYDKTLLGTGVTNDAMISYKKLLLDPLLSIQHATHGAALPVGLAGVGSLAYYLLQRHKNKQKEALQQQANTARV